MDDSKVIAMVLVVVAMVGLWLTKEGKVEPVVNVIANNSTTTGNAVTMGEYVGAFLVYLFVLSFLSQESGIWLTVILVLGGLLYNSKHSKDGGLITELTTPINTTQ